MKNTKEYWINKLHLQEHNEGGYFHQNYLSNAKAIIKNGQSRALMSSIYFLLTTNNPSHFHRLKSDEIWYYHFGATVFIHLFLPNGQYECIKLGEDDYLQYVVPAGTIFASEVAHSSTLDFAVVGCAVTPSFTYDEFELFTQQQLLAKYPNYDTIIKRLAYPA